MPLPVPSAHFVGCLLTRPPLSPELDGKENTKDTKHASMPRAGSRSLLKNREIFTHVNPTNSYYFNTSPWAYLFGLIYTLLAVLTTDVRVKLSDYCN